MAQMYATILLSLALTASQLAVAVAVEPDDRDESKNVLRLRLRGDHSDVVARPRHQIHGFQVERDEHVLVQNDPDDIGMDLEWNRVLGGYYDAGDHEGYSGDMSMVDCIPLNRNSKSSKSSKGSSTSKSSKSSKSASCKYLT